jgi:transcription initiation factor TFIID subunit TAF12
MATVNIKKLIKESISEYLAELNTEKENQEEASSGYMGYTEKVITEGESEFEDKVTKDGNIYLVRKPNKDTGEAGIVQEVSLKELLSSLSDEFIGAYTVNTQALTAGKKALKARDAKLKENIQMGKSKVAELETKIEELKLKIEDNSTRAIHDSKRRDELTETNNTLFTQLEKIENAIEKLKAVLDKESPKKAKKEDKDNE